MLIIFNEDGYLEIIVDGRCWVYANDIPLSKALVHSEIPLLIFMDEDTYPYLYWAWSS